MRRICGILAKHQFDKLNVFSENFANHLNKSLDWIENKKKLTYIIMSVKTVSPSRPFIKMTSSVYLPSPLPVLEMYTPIIVTQFPQKPLLMEKEKEAVVL